MRRKTVLTLFLCGVMINAGFADLSDQLDQGLEYKKAGNYSQAETIYQDIITNNPQSHYAANAKINLARMYKKTGRYSEAETLYQQVLASETGANTAVEAQKHLAILYVATNRDSEAGLIVNELKTGFSGHIDLPGSLNGIARAYQRAGKEIQAKEIYQYIDSEYGGWFYAFAAHKKLVDMGVATETNAGASAAIEQLANKIPHVTNTDVVLPDIGEVLSDINRLVTNYAGYPYLPGIVYRAAQQYYVMASLLEVKGLGSEAEAYYQKAGSIYDVFVSEFSGSASQFPHLAGFAYDFAGSCYKQLGQYQKSIASYQKLANDCPGHPMAWNGLAMIGRNYKLMEKAGVISTTEAQINTKAVYEQLVSNYPDCKAAKMAGSWLNQYK